MKLLLVSDIPPCTNYTAGIVLDQLCRFLPQGSIACSIVRNPVLTDAVMTPDLDWIPVDYIPKPPEHGLKRPHRSRLFNNVASFLAENYYEFFHCPRIVDRIVRFGRDFGADLVWCVLQGQTEIRIARPIARKLGVPLLTMTWDPLNLWLDGHHINHLSQKRIYRQFGEALHHSRKFGAASWAMSEEYGRRYDVPSASLVQGLDARFAMPAAHDFRSPDKFILSAAGKVYPDEIWQSLVAALRSVDWTIAGRKVEIRVLCREHSLPWEGSESLQLLGWHPQQDAVRLLAETDLLFCPYWLDPAFADVTRLSFPGKLVTYLASGRPVMFLGPDDASPAKFLREHNADLMCHSASPDAILGTLRRLCEEPGLYARLAKNGRKAFDQCLTLEAARRRFAEFLGVAENELVLPASPFVGETRAA